MEIRKIMRLGTYTLFFVFFFVVGQSINVEAHKHSAHEHKVHVKLAGEISHEGDENDHVVDSSSEDGMDEQDSENIESAEERLANEQQQLHMEDEQKKFEEETEKKISKKEMKLKQEERVAEQKLLADQERERTGLEDEHREEEQQLEKQSKDLEKQLQKEEDERKRKVKIVRNDRKSQEKERKEELIENKKILYEEQKEERHKMDKKRFEHAHQKKGPDDVDSGMREHGHKHKHKHIIDAEETSERLKKELREDAEKIERNRQEEEKLLREAEIIAKKIKHIEEDEVQLSGHEERRIKEYEERQSKEGDEMKLKEEEMQKMVKDRERRRKEDEINEERIFMEAQERQTITREREERKNVQKHNEYLDQVKTIETRREKLVAKESDMKKRRDEYRSLKLDKSLHGNEHMRTSMEVETPIKTLNVNSSDGKSPANVIDTIRVLMQEMNGSVEATEDNHPNVVGESKKKIVFLKYKDSNTTESKSKWDGLFSAAKSRSGSQADVIDDTVLLTKSGEFYKDFGEQQKGTAFEGESTPQSHHMESTNEGQHNEPSKKN